MDSTKSTLMVTSIDQEKEFDIYNRNDSEELEEPGTVAPKYRGTVADRKDMSTLGKKQVLRVCHLAQWLEGFPIDYHSATFAFLRCWASRALSWPAGRFYCRKHTDCYGYGISITDDPSKDFSRSS